MEFVTSFGKYDVAVTLDRYVADGSLYVGLVDKNTGEPFADVTVCFDEPLLTANPEADENETFCYIDTNNLPEVEEFIKSNGLGKPTKITKASGFCTYPLYKMNLGKLRELAVENYYDKRQIKEQKESEDE